MKRILLIGALVAMMVLSGCSVNEGQAGNPVNRSVASSSEVSVTKYDVGMDNPMYRVVFHEDGVVCYMGETATSYGDGTGVGCIPLDQTMVDSGGM